MQTAAQITGSILMLLLGSDGVTPTPHDPAFITTWDTTKDGATSSNEILISTNNSAGQYFTIDWGDGNVDEDVTGDNIHAYNEPGVYTVKITGDFPRIYFSDVFEGGGNYDNEKLLSVDNWGDIEWQTMENAFFTCINMVVNAKDAPNLSNVTDMSYMFYNAFKFNQPIGHWDTSNVSDMSAMFTYALSFNQPIGDWETSSVTDMRSMFEFARSFNQPIGTWNTSKVTKMASMFFNASAFNQPIDTWKTSKVISMEYMFRSATAFNQPIGSWDTSNVTDMSDMFYRATAFNQPIDSWNTSNVTDMASMFYNATGFSDKDLSVWNVANVTDHTDFMTSAGSGNTEPIWP